MRHCNSAVPVHKNNAKITKIRIIHSKITNNCASSNWRHDWWQINHKTYAKFLKGDNLLQYSSQESKLKNQVFPVKTKQNANKCVARKFNIEVKTSPSIIQPQGVKSEFIEYDKHHIINNNHIDKCVNIDTNQGVNKSV